MQRFDGTRAVAPGETVKPLPPPGPAELAKAEAVATEDLLLRGCPPDVAGETRATWRSSIQPWREIFDRWPGGMVDESGRHPKSLLIWGPVGSGKSHVASWIMRRYLAASLHRIEAKDPDGNVVLTRTASSAIWIDAALAMKAILQAFKTRTEEPWPKMDHAFTVIDDLFATQPTEYQDQVTSDWVRERYSSAGHTVYTTNLTPLQLRDSHPRSASRLMAGPVQEMTGSDARRKQWRFA